MDPHLKGLFPHNWEDIDPEINFGQMLHLQEFISYVAEMCYVIFKLHTLSQNGNVILQNLHAQKEKQGSA